MNPRSRHPPQRPNDTASGIAAAGDSVSRLGACKAAVLEAVLSIETSSGRHIGDKLLE
jgi:hypothetical protein